KITAERRLIQWAIDQILPEHAGEPFKAALSGNVLEIVTAQDQDTRLAIDLAQHSLRCDHVLQPISDVACLATRHVSSPSPVDGSMTQGESMPSILIKIINMPTDDATPSPRWLTADQATAHLGVSRQTLYAYV